MEKTFDISGVFLFDFGAKKMKIRNIFTDYNSKDPKLYLGGGAFIMKNTRGYHAIIEDWKKLIAMDYATSADHTDAEDAKALQLVLETLDSLEALAEKINMIDCKLSMIQTIVSENKEAAAE